MMQPSGLKPQALKTLPITTAPVKQLCCIVPWPQARMLPKITEKCRPRILHGFCKDASKDAFQSHKKNPHGEKLTRKHGSHVLGAEEHRMVTAGNAIGCFVGDTSGVGVVGNLIA